MGADLYLSSLPHAELTDERKDELEEAIEKVADNDVLSFNKDFLCMELPDLGALDMAYGEGSEDKALAALVREHILVNACEALECADDPRDVASISYPGMEYRVLITGGLSWGDTPTESCRTFDACSGFEPVWDTIEKWAKADFKFQ